MRLKHRECLSRVEVTPSEEFELTKHTVAKVKPETVFQSVQRDAVEDEVFGCDLANAIYEKRTDSLDAGAPRNNDLGFLDLEPVIQPHPSRLPESGGVVQ